MPSPDFLQGPNAVHPERPSAVGSRNSLSREGRDEYQESKLVVDEEVDKILNHINSKLPPEALSRLNIAGNVKELLHNYVNQSYQNMYNRYITTVEDEMAKKFRNMVDHEESLSQKRYTPRGIGELLSEIGGEDRFNSAEIEKGVVNVYSHLQGHLQRGVAILEFDTNSILRQKTDIGAVVRGENAYSIVKCSISNHTAKPENVNDVILSINILDEELISRIYHYQTYTERIIRDVVSEGIIEKINRDVSKINEALIDQGQKDLGSSEVIFEKIKLLDQHLSENTVENADGVKVGKYSLVGQKVYNAIKGVVAEFNPNDYDPLAYAENIQHTVDNENLRNRGFNSAVNAISTILDAFRLPYQHIENFKNRRMVVIRENKHLDAKEIPDENYEIHMTYYDPRQLNEQKVAYQQQMEEFVREVDQLERLVHKVYVKIQKKDLKRIDYQDLVKIFYVRDTVDAQDESDDMDLRDNQGIWVGVTPSNSFTTEVEAQHPTFKAEYQTLVKRLNRMQKKIKGIFVSNYPKDRVAIEDRVKLVHSKLLNFYKQYNPFHVQPGLVLSVRLSTIKRKQTTLRAMGDVLNEFLYKASSGFNDKAFANFSRRRSIDDKLTDLMSESMNL